MACMKCAELREVGKPVVITERPVPQPPAKGLIVKTLFSGVCHSDLTIQDDKIEHGGGRVVRYTDRPGYKFPVVMGHEAAGVIHSLGEESREGSEDLRIGERVLVYPWVGCCSDNCKIYRSGAGNMCNIWKHNVGFGFNGGYSTHVSVPDKMFVVKVPDSIPMDTAAMLPCSGLTAYHAIKLLQPTIEELAALKGHASVLIVGAGGLGLWAVQLAKAVFPPSTRMIVADISEEKLRTASEYGADRTALWTKDAEESDLISRTRQSGLGGTIEGVIDFVNSSQTTPKGNNCLAKGGALVCVGLFGGSITLSLPAVVTTARKIFGCFVGSLSLLRELVELMSNTQIKSPPKEYTTLDNVNNALDRLRQGHVKGRAIIRFD